MWQSMTKKRAGNLHGGSDLSDTRAAYALLFPFLIFFMLFVLYPVVKNFYYSFTNYNLTQAPQWVGFKNYARLLRDRVFLRAVSNTVWYALWSVSGLMGLGLAAAIALSRPVRWAKGVQLLCVYPYATSMTAVSMIWLLLFDPFNGYANKLLLLCGIPAQQWLFSQDQALGCLIFVNVWKNLGYCMLVLLAGLQHIDPVLYEAARVDGAGAFAQLRRITLPALSPVLQALNRLKPLNRCRS
ncbi:MAG: sugar ABC transporter permease [Clostridia bacterium]